MPWIEVIETHVPTNRPLAAWIRELEGQGKLYAFYKTPEWRALKEQVLEDHGHECEACAAAGRYTRADTVHHEKEVRKFPGLALTRWVGDPDGARREVLHPLCNRCHNDVHDRCNGARRAAKGSKPKDVTEERWD